jgi:hypothetical protein
MGLGDVAVPVPDGDPRFLGEGGDTVELVIDEAFQRRYIEHGDARGILLIDPRENGKESRFGFARGGFFIVVFLTSFPDTAGGDGNLHSI